MNKDNLGDFLKDRPWLLELPENAALLEASPAPLPPAAKAYKTAVKEAQVESLAAAALDVIFTALDELGIDRGRLRYGANELVFDRDNGRRWRFDYALFGSTLAIEVEGGQWVNGRHQRGAGYAADCEKYNAAILQGWQVLRFTTSQVRNGEMLATLRQWGDRYGNE